MPATYEPIATTTLGSAAASITFSSIAGTYTDLRLVLVGTATTAAPDVYFRLNSDSATNYSGTNLGGTGASAYSSRYTSTATVYVDTIGLSTTIPHLYEMDFFSYAGSTYKTALVKTSEDNNGSGGTSSTVVLWRSTSAITSIALFLSANNFQTGTTATLYGIKAA